MTNSLVNVDLKIRLAEAELWADIQMLILASGNAKIFVKEVNTSVLQLRSLVEIQANKSKVLGIINSLDNGLIEVRTNMYILGIRIDSPFFFVNSIKSFRN